MILVDSGPLIAAAIADDRDRRRCVDMFAALHLNSEKLLVPQTVVAEVDPSTLVVRRRLELRHHLVERPATTQQAESTAGR